MSGAVSVTVPRLKRCPVGERFARRASETAQMIEPERRSDIGIVAQLVAGDPGPWLLGAIGEGLSLPSRSIRPHWRGGVAAALPRAGTQAEHSAIAARFDAAGAL